MYVEIRARLIVSRKTIVALLVVISCLFVSCNKSNPVPPIGDQPVYPQMDAYPARSPDGEKVVFISYDYTKYDRENNATMWVMDADGTNKH